MNDEPSDDRPGLIDQDPTLEYILYEKMGQEYKRNPARGGCLSLALFLLLPLCGVPLLLDLIL